MKDKILGVLCLLPISGVIIYASLILFEYAGLLGVLAPWFITILTCVGLILLLGVKSNES